MEILALIFMYASFAVSFIVSVISLSAAFVGTFEGTPVVVISAKIALIWGSLINLWFLFNYLENGGF